MAFSVQLSQIVGLLNILVDELVHPPRTAALILGGSDMPGSINVDTTNETVTLAFADHAGNPAPEPAGASVTFTSDNEAVLTVATDPANPLQGDVTPLTVGQANLGASLTGADGNPLLEADGVTPFPAPDPVLVTVSAGAAESASLSLSV